MNSLAKLNPDTAPVETWPEPQALAGNQYEPEAYPIECLPEGIRAAVLDVHQTSQAPMAMIGTCAISALSLAAQGHVSVARDEVTHGPVSIFALIEAPSGERKTTVDGFFNRTVREYESLEFEVAKPLINEYQAAFQIWEGKRAGLKDAIKHAAKNNKQSVEFEAKLRELEQAKPKAPMVPELLVGDATSEALTFNLATKWPSAGIVSSEAAVIFGGAAMGSDAITRNLGALNQLWEGGTLKTARRSVESFAVRNARLTVCLQVQKAVLREFLAKGGNLARGSGFLARFLICAPESTQGTRFYREPSKHLAGLARFDARITQLLTEPIRFDETGHGIETTMLTFSTDAKNIWVEAFNLIESELAPSGDLSDVRDIASKSMDNAARLAALFHVFEHGTAGTIGADSVRAGCELAAWHLGQAQYLLAEIAQAPSVNQATKLDAWLIKRCTELSTNRIATSDVSSYAPRGLRLLDEYLPPLHELETAERAKLASIGNKKFVVVNPKLLSEGE